MYITKALEFGISGAKYTQMRAHGNNGFYIGRAIPPLKALKTTILKSRPLLTSEAALSAPTSLVRNVEHLAV